MEIHTALEAIDDPMVHRPLFIGATASKCGYEIMASILEANNFIISNT